MKAREISHSLPLQPETSDPVLSMLGVGKQLWHDESGDHFVERLRAEEAPPFDAPPDTAAELEESTWQRIKRHQGEEFKTVTGLPFTYLIEGNGIWFDRGGKRINRKLTRSQVNEAIARCPLTRTTEIKDLIDYPYLFSLLADTRIRTEAW